MLLENKIKNREGAIAIVGLGYVGLPLAVEFAKSGFSVIGIDVSKEKVNAINSGKSYIQDVDGNEVSELVRDGKLRAVAKYDILKQVDAVIICVPTPLNRVKEPDLSFILQATEKIAKYLHKNQLVILESTTYPGTTDEVILPKLEPKGLKVGKDFFLCFSPERIDPGNKKFPVPTIPKVVGGITARCTELGALLYGQVFFKVVPVSSARTAEMAKLLENTFRIVNIALVNELATVAGALKVDIWEAIEAAKSKPFGFMPFYPGPGVGGHCIGIDPIYLSWKARVHGMDVRSIELAREINTNMPHYVVDRIQKILISRMNKSARKARILLIGISYKKDVGDTRESPSFEILEELHQLGASISYHDPYVPKLDFGKINLQSKALSGSSLRANDLVVILTDHSTLDYQLIEREAKFIFDARNVMKNFKSKKIIRL